MTYSFLLQKHIGGTHLNRENEDIFHIIGQRWTCHSINGSYVYSPFTFKLYGSYNYREKTALETDLEETDLKISELIIE